MWERERDGNKKLCVYLLKISLDFIFLWATITNFLAVISLLISNAHLMKITMFTIVKMLRRTYVACHCHHAVIAHCHHWGSLFCSIQQFSLQENETKQNEIRFIPGLVYQSWDFNFYLFTYLSIVIARSMSHQHFFCDQVFRVVFLLLLNGNKKPSSHFYTFVTNLFSLSMNKVSPCLSTHTHTHNEKRNEATNTQSY